MGPDGLAAINVKSTVVLSEAQALNSTSRRPIHHVFDHNIIDFAFGFEYFEDFIARNFKDVVD